MNVFTSRFGEVEIEEEDVIEFDSGLIGFDDRKDWVILADAENDAIAWLQSLEDPELAMAVVSPRRFVPAYQVEIPPTEAERIKLNGTEQAFVLAVVSRNDHSLTINLRAPIVVALERRKGWQIVSEGDQPLQYELDRSDNIELRRSA